MEIVFEGVLEISKSPTTHSRDWKQRLFVLKSHIETKRASLDYYKDVKKRWQKQEKKGIISLWPWFTVSVAHNCSYKYAMKLMTPESTVYLTASSFKAMNQWFYHLQTQRILEPPKKDCHVYPVQTQDSDSMNIIGARGDCLLALTTEMEIVCALASNKQVVGVWPFDCLRRYWCGEGMFGFEAGRRSPRGEGKYSFITSKDEEIYRTLQKFIEKAKRSSISSSSSADSTRYDDRPPAPLPTDARQSETPVSSSDSEEGGRETSKKKSKDQDGGKALALGYDVVRTPPVPPKASRSPSQGKHQSPKVKGKSLRTPPTHDMIEVTGTSPAYLKRARTHSGFANAWLHETVQPPATQGKRRSVHGQPLPPPPVAFTGEEIRTRDPLEEDTYSHTVHRIPGPFQRRASDHGAVSGSLYNALVHHQDPSIRHKKRPGVQDDTALYDVAFTPHRSIRGRSTLSNDAEYGTVSSPDPNFSRTNVSRVPGPQPSRVPGPQPPRVPDPHSSHVPDPHSSHVPDPQSSVPTPQLAKLPTDRPSNLMQSFQPIKEEPDMASPLPRKQSDDGLTVNPLYGSQDDLLAAVSALDDLEDSMESPDPTKWFKPPEGGEKKVMNPVYGDPKKLGMNLPKGEGQTREQDGINGLDATPEGSAIPRDALGYSKVDKNKKNEANMEDSDEPVPPPLPERNYSWDSSSGT